MVHRAEYLRTSTWKEMWTFCRSDTIVPSLHPDLSSIRVSPGFSLVLYFPLHLRLLTQSKKSKRDQWKNVSPWKPIKGNVYQTRYMNDIIDYCAIARERDWESSGGFCCAPVDRTELTSRCQASWGCAFSNLKHHSEHMNDASSSSSSQPCEEDGSASFLQLGKLKNHNSGTTWRNRQRIPGKTRS